MYGQISQYVSYEREGKEHESEEKYLGQQHVKEAPNNQEYVWVSRLKRD